MNFDVNTNEREVTLKIKGYPKRLVKRVDRAANQFVQRVTSDAKVAAPEAESNLKNSIKAKKLGLMDYVTGPSQNYGGFVESGTNTGGVPPLQSLLDWIRVRRLQPHTKGYTERDLAYAIQQKIKKSGTPSQPYMLPAFNRNEPLLSLLINQQVNGGGL